MNLILRFLKSKRLTFAMLFAIAFFYSVIYYLYGLPLEAILYAGLLSLVVVGIFFTILAIIEVKNTQAIDLCRQQIDHGGVSALVPSALPQANQNETLAYKELLIALAGAANYSQSTFDLIQEERSDSYHLWVHQIKTPIAALNLMMQTETDSPKLRAMYSELFKIEQYVEMALHMARLESATEDLNLGPCKLEEVVNSVIKKYKILFIEKKIALNIQVPDITLLTDSKWLSVILEQYISNALKYTHQGSITVAFKMEPDPCLEVTDTGMGIAAEDLPRIFEKGYTGYNGRMDKRATGLGLYVANKAASIIGSKLSVASTVGQGTQARCTLNLY